MITLERLVEASCKAITEGRGYSWPDDFDTEEQSIARTNMRAALDAVLACTGFSLSTTWPINTDDEVEALARECSWDNRKYMTPDDYSIWCERMRKFARLASAPSLAALAAQPAPAVAVPDGLLEYYQRQINWSRETFGPALRTKGVIDHIRKELVEIEDDPHDLSEWVDVVILAMDGFWRHGGNAEDLFPALLAKQRKNMARTWPDWRTMSEDAAIEHDRSGEASTAAPQPAPQPVAVKPLEWEDGFIASTPFGAYTISDYADDRWVFSYHTYPYAVESDDDFETEAEAKAAAQADYEQRILSALTTHPADLREENERLKQLLRSANAEIESQHAQHIAYVERSSSNATAAEARVKALEEALQAIIDMNVQYATDKYGDASKAEAMACVMTARAALKGGE